MMKFNNKEVKDVLFNGQPINVLQYNGVTVWERNHSRLPNEYQEVEYLESTGTQYIDTNILPNNNMVIDAVLSTNGDDTMPLFGTRYSATDRNIGASITGMIYIDFGDYTVNRLSIKKTPIKDEILNIHLGYDYLSINENRVNTKQITFNSDKSIKLFWFDGGAQGNIKMAGKFYSFIVKEYDTLIQNLVPCYRKADNVAGMYDLVSNTFFTNQGTGDFITGGEV